ncbi:MAG: pyruvate kinase [Acidimicrobiales bacterium]
MTRRTKIVATVGPASESPEQLEALIQAGADVFRLGLAHGDAAQHLARVERIRKAAAAAGRPIALLIDLPGRKVRAAGFPDGGVFLAEGDQVLLVPGESKSTATRIEVGYAPLLDDLEPGDIIAIGDGAILLQVEELEDHAWQCVVVAAGRVQGRPGVHIPAGKLRLTTPTDDDLELLDQMAPAEPDIVAVSFVRRAEDLEPVRSAVGDRTALVLAKIETRGACEDLESIIEASDALMVARGDLGLECPVEEVPHLQKRIVRTGIAWGKPVIIATQMLESMVHAPRPTRAEASDVANAVFDGTDAVMLSGETAIGHDPVLAVRTMASIVERAEAHADYLAWGGRLGKLQRAAETPKALAITAAVTHAAWRAAVELDARAILCCTRSGQTARAMARFRPLMPIVGSSPDESVVRGLALSWGVVPELVDWYDSTDDMVWHVVERAVHTGFARPGDFLVVIAGAPSPDEQSASDVLRVVRVR